LRRAISAADDAVGAQQLVGVLAQPLMSGLLTQLTKL
jgi:hypothetical protein